MTQSIVIQQTLEGLGGAPPRPPEMTSDRPISFGRVVMPYFFQINPDEYGDITSDIMEGIAPEELRSLVLPGEGRGDFTVDGVAMNAHDYELLPRNVASMVRAVGNRTHRANASGSVDGQRARGDRSVLHALEAKQVAMQGRLPVLQANEKRMWQLAKEARAPGYAHMRSSVLYDLAYSVRYGDFANLLDIAGREGGWTGSDLALASRALDARLFLVRNADRLGNWREMLGLTSEHNQGVMGVYGLRMDGVAYQIGRIRRHAARTT